MTQSGSPRRPKTSRTAETWSRTSATTTSTPSRRWTLRAQRSNYFGYEDDIMLQPSRDWLEQHKDGPFLATYLGVTGHHQYLPIDRYGRKDYSTFPPLNNY